MPAAGEPVVLVHGLWMNGLEFGVLRNRLQHAHGFDVHVFPYPSMHGNAAEIAADLAEFARRRAADAGGQVHFVGHSLGGALVYRALTERLEGIAGKAVLLGAPLNGSRAASSVASHPFLRPLLGVHVPHELAQSCGRCWQSNEARALGAIAGSRRLGTGQFFAHFDEEHDGTVAVSETRIPGLDDHIVLPHSHIGMLFAADVALQVAHFLRRGRFDRPQAAP